MSSSLQDNVLIHFEKPHELNEVWVRKVVAGILRHGVNHVNEFDGSFQDGFQLIENMLHRFGESMELEFPTGQEELLQIVSSTAQALDRAREVGSEKINEADATSLAKSVLGDEIAKHEVEIIRKTIGSSMKELQTKLELSKDGSSNEIVSGIDINTSTPINDGHAVIRPEHVNQPTGKGFDSR